MNIAFKVVSDSMTPLIKISDSLKVVSENKNYKIFDIIVFKRSSDLVVHYVWRNQIEFNQTVITRSLKNIYSDEEPIHKNEIIGQVTNFEIGPLLKYKILFLCFIARAL